MNSGRSTFVDVFQLARERATIEGELRLADLPRLASSLLSQQGSLRYRIRGEVDERGRPGATMELQATLLLECQRCTADLAFPLRREARFLFVSDEEELNALPIEDDEVDVVLGSRQMDVANWIEDEAILSLPLIPRHGTCRPPATKDAAAAATEPPAARPSPFAALAALKPRRKAS